MRRQEARGLPAELQRNPDSVAEQEYNFVLILQCIIMQRYRRFEA